MRWAHQKNVNSTDKAKSSKMDMGGVAGTGGWDQQPDQQQNDHFMGMMKGKGKYYPKGGYGYGKRGSRGWNPGKGTKGGFKCGKGKGWNAGAY